MQLHDNRTNQIFMEVNWTHWTWNESIMKFNILFNVNAVYISQASLEVTPLCLHTQCCLCGFRLGMDIPTWLQRCQPSIWFLWDLESNTLWSWFIYVRITLCWHLNINHLRAAECVMQYALYCHDAWMQEKIVLFIWSWEPWLRPQHQVRKDILSSGDCYVQ